MCRPAREEMVRMNRLWGLLILLTLLAPAVSPARGQSETALAYVWQGTVMLADGEGEPLVEVGPRFEYGQGARLVWTPDADTLYIARDDGFYAVGADGGAAVRVPGLYGRTVTIAQDQSILYYLETTAPQPLEDSTAEAEYVSYPLRTIPLDALSGGAGRLEGYFGHYLAGASRADLNFAAAQYVREGGLLGLGRPNLWPSYGPSVFGTCCFPDPGLAEFRVGTGEAWVYDPSFLPGAADVNLTRTHLAGATTDGLLRVMDLITGGVRDYPLAYAGGIGQIERVAWSPDDSHLYFVARRDPSNPLLLNEQPAAFSVDVRSADLYVYRLDLVTSLLRELAWRPNAYGVSSLAATEDYVFAVVVDPNTALVNALNARQVRPGSAATDPALAQYIPATHLWRIPAEGGEGVDLLDDVWGLASRPVRG
jgi:hypothetical protein